MKRQRQATLSFGSSDRPSPSKPTLPSSTKTVIDLTTSGDSGDDAPPTPTNIKKPVMSPASPTAPSAFSRMMADPGRLVRRERFCIGQTATGGWRWSWALMHKPSTDPAKAAGACGDQSLPAWQQTVTVSYAGRPCTILLASEVASAPASPSPLKTGFTPSLLKSALQKSVRRGHSAAACTAALTLWRCNPVDLVRRVLVIAIEDVCVHPAYPVLAWLTMALAKGFIPSQGHLLLVLSVIRELCQCPWKDDFDAEAEDTSQGSILHEFRGSKAEEAVNCLQLQRRLERSELACAPVGTDTPIPTAGVVCATTASVLVNPEVIDSLGSPHAQGLVRSILLRAAYGGMAGDVTMLRRAGAVWLARFLRSPRDWMNAIQVLCVMSNSDQMQSSSFAAEASAGGDKRWCYYTPCFNATDLSNIPSAASLRTVITAVEDGCSDLSLAIINDGGAQVEEWAAHVCAKLHKRSPEALLETLQRQVWDLRSCLNARCPAHIARAMALRDALIVRCRHGSGGAVSGSARPDPTRVEDACAGSWAELDPARNALALSTMSRCRLTSVSPSGFVPASALTALVTSAERTDIEAFACVAGAVETWSALHLSRRS